MIWLAVASVICVALLIWALVPAPSQMSIPRMGRGSTIGERQNLGIAAGSLWRRLLGRGPKAPAGPALLDAGFLHPELARKNAERQSPLAWILSLGSRALPMPEAQTKELGGRLNYVGVGMGAREFSGLKIISMFGAAFACVALLPELVRMHGMVLIPATIVFGFLAPELWLRSRIAARNKAILRLLPEVIDLLSLCMGAGLDFLGALNRVVAVKVGADNKKKEPLLEEVSVVMQEIKFGKRRSEALRAMSKRVNLPEISSFVRTLVQADRMGTPIKEVLAVHSEDVRFERYNRAEREALKAPIKILVPLIFCILPCVAIIVGAPVFIQFSRLKLTGE